MWVKLDSNDKVIAEYPRPGPLTVKSVQYPASIFSSAKTLQKFRIFPVRRVQANAPEDTLGWFETHEDALAGDTVIRTITWTERPEAPALRIERAVEQAKHAMISKRVALGDWMAGEGFWNEAQLTPADLTRFETDFEAAI